MDRISIIKQHTYQGMTAFVISSQTFFFVADHTAAAFRTHDNTLGRFFHFRHIDFILIFTGSHQRSFIDQIAQIRAGKTRSSAGNNAKLDFRTDRLTFNMDF